MNLANLGYHIKGKVEDVHPKEMQSIIEKIKGTKEEEVNMYNYASFYDTS